MASLIGGATTHRRATTTSLGSHKYVEKRPILGPPGSTRPAWLKPLWWPPARRRKHDC
jgi:hypothetical protein